MIALLLSFFLLRAVAGASLPSSSYVLHEKRDVLVPTGWIDHGQIDPQFTLPFKFGLVQPNLPLDDLLNDVSHPDSANYGKHWSPEDVIHKFAPSSETTDAVYEWLSDHFGHEKLQITSNRLWITVNLTVAEAERLLDSQYKLYTHGQSGVKHIGMRVSFRFRCRSLTFL